MLAVNIRKLLLTQIIFRPYLAAGMTAIDIGCGMGFFTISMANMAGEQGMVIAVDLQPQMLKGMLERAGMAGMENIT